MARTSAKVGRGPCPCCGERVSFHRTAGGLLNFECGACDIGAYAHKNGASEAKWLASIDDPVAAPAPAPAPEPAPAPTPPKKPARTASAFAVGNL